MDIVLLVLMLAVVVEGLVEYAKSIGDLARNKDKRPLLIQLGALVVSVILALLTGADFFTGLGIVFKYPMVGSLLTGVFLSRGSNYISDFIGRLRKGYTKSILESTSTNKII